MEKAGGLEGERKVRRELGQKGKRDERNKG